VRYIKKYTGSKINKAGLSAMLFVCSSFFTIAAAQEAPRAAMKTNAQIVYYDKPGKVDSFADMFAKGKFYGRLRSNTFYFWWDVPEANKKNDVHLVSGLGGSLVYKSGMLGGFDFGGGLYYSRAFFKAKSDPIFGLKGGKDLLSRFDFVNTGDKSMAVLGQAYLRYSGIAQSEIVIGRQLVETFYAKSNDTKMIPNTFDGLVLGTKAIPDTTVKLGYLYKQKLRDHTQAHSVLMFGDANSSSADMPQWSGNDDSAMHRGLTYTRLKAAGISTHAPLIVGDIHNRSVKKLKVDAAFYVVPEIVSQVMGELNYRFDLPGTLSVAPGLRYIRQFDNGGGSVGGAALFGQLAGKHGASYGYRNADSLDSQMIAARIVAKIDNYAVNLAYSMVFDEADLVTPWRAFPTSGYTRSMGRYNWFANTRSYRIKLTRNANSTGIYKDLFTELSVLYTDADENKYVTIGNVNLKYADQIYYYAGFVQNLPSMPELQWRLRLGYNDTELEGWDNLDARFELNYLF
jgi:hypothetical protein